MTEKEEYRREVLLISLEKDNKRLLEIYRRGEEKDTLSQRAYENVYERVSYALSSSSLMNLEKLPDLEERIIFFFDEDYYDKEFGIEYIFYMNWLHLYHFFTKTSISSLVKR